MRLITFILVVFLGVNSCYAQNKELLAVVEYELIGKWEGKLTQGGDSKLSPTYFFELELALKGNKIEGHSFIQTGANIAKISLMGRLNGLTIEIEEIEFVDKKIKKAYFWCIKNLHLEFGFDHGRYRLKGTWEGKSGLGDCSPGTLEVFKPTIRA